MNKPVEFSEDSYGFCGIIRVRFLKEETLESMAGYVSNQLNKYSEVWLTFKEQTDLDEFYQDNHSLVNDLKNILNNRGYKFNRVSPVYGGVRFDKTLVER